MSIIIYLLHGLLFFGLLALWYYISFALSIYAVQWTKKLRWPMVIICTFLVPPCFLATYYSVSTHIFFDSGITFQQGM